MAYSSMFEEDFGRSSSDDERELPLDSSEYDENEQYGFMHRLFSSHDTYSSSEEHTPKGSRSSSTRRIQVSCYEPGHGHRQQGLQQQQQKQQQKQKPRELSPEQIQLVVGRLHRRQQMVRSSGYRQHAVEAKEQQAARKQRRAEQQQKEEERRQAELQRAQTRAFNEQCGHLLQGLNAPRAPVAAAVVVLDSGSAAQHSVRVPAPPPCKAEGPVSPRVAAAHTATHSSAHSSNKGSTSSSTTSRSSSSSSKRSALSAEQEWALKQQAKQARLLQQQEQQQPSWYQPGARAYEQREARRQQAQAEEVDRQKLRDSSRSQQGRSAVACLLTSLLSKNSRSTSPSTPTPTPSAASPPQPTPERSCKAPKGKLRPVKEGQEAEWIAADVLREQREQAAAEAQAAERARVMGEIRKLREAEQQAAAERQRAAEQARRQEQEEEQWEIALHGSFKAAFRRSSKKLRTLVRSLSSKQAGWQAPHTGKVFVDRLARTASLGGLEVGSWRFAGWWLTRRCVTRLCCSQFH